MGETACTIGEITSWTALTSLNHRANLLQHIMCVCVWLCMYTCIYIILYWLVASPRQHAGFGIIRNLLLHPCSGFHFKITLPRVIPTVANILPITFYHTIWHFIWQNILTYYLKSSMTLYLAFYLEFHLTFTLTYFRIFWRLSSILSAILSDIRFGSGSPHRAHELAIGFGSGKPQRADKLAVQYLSGAGVCVCTPLLHRAWCLLSFIQTWQTTRGLRFAGGQACHIQPGQRSWDVIGEAWKEALTCTCTLRLQTVEQAFVLLCFLLSSFRQGQSGPSFNFQSIQCVYIALAYIVRGGPYLCVAGVVCKQDRSETQFSLAVPTAERHANKGWYR